jgi:voltage-gated potassium channel
MYQKTKSLVYELLDPSQGGNRADKVVNSFVVGLILLNTLAVILETVESIYKPYSAIFNAVELFSVIVFSTEYVLRVWTCTANPKYRGSLSGRIKYIFSFGAIIDLLAILPFYIPLLGGKDLRFVRSLRLLRFFRFFKLGRYLNASKLIGNVFRAKKEELVLSFVITLFLIVLASCIMYYAEHDAQPEKFSSIPETMWWSVATLTTVGYGDEYPITALGKFLTACISILGIGMFALPAGILASGFGDEFKKLKKQENCCPYCNKEL